MSDFVVYVNLPDYLAEWYMHEMGQKSPVRVPRSSPESCSMKLHLRKPKDDDIIVPKGKYTAICIPTYREIDVRTYNTLTKEGHESLRRIIHDRFFMALYHDLLKLITYKGPMRYKDMKTEKQERIHCWMKKNGISDTETNYLAVLKNFDRMRDNFLTSERRRLRKN